VTSAPERHERGRMLEVLSRVHRPDRLPTFIEDYADEVDSAVYWRVLAQLWTDTESPSLYEDDGPRRSLIRSISRRAVP
jgi:hypothetical protein